MIFLIGDTGLIGANLVIGLLACHAEPVTCIDKRASIGKRSASHKSHDDSCCDTSRPVEVEWNVLHVPFTEAQTRAVSYVEAKFLVDKFDVRTREMGNTSTVLGSGLSSIAHACRNSRPVSGGNEFRRVLAFNDELNGLLKADETNASCGSNNSCQAFKVACAHSAYVRHQWWSCRRHTAVAVNSPVSPTDETTTRARRLAFGKSRACE
jgi:hypothetical protein